MSIQLHTTKVKGALCHLNSFGSAAKYKLCLRCTGVCLLTVDYISIAEPLTEEILLLDESIEIEAIYRCLERHT